MCDGEVASSYLNKIDHLFNNEEKATTGGGLGFSGAVREGRRTMSACFRHGIVKYKPEIGKISTTGQPICSVSRKQHSGPDASLWLSLQVPMSQRA